jgi:sec-independent protein translocase protein TatB
VFDVGFSKLLIILAVALIVLGPEKLPAMAGQIGRWLGRARSMARQFRDQLEEEASTLQNAKRSFTTALDPNAPLHTPAAPAATPGPATVYTPTAGPAAEAAPAAATPSGAAAPSDAGIPQPVLRTPPAPPPAVVVAAPPAAAANAPAAMRAPAFAATPDYASAAVTQDTNADERGA